MPKKTLYFLTLINLFNYLDRWMINGVLPLLLVDLALSKEQGGFLVSSYVIGYVLFSPVFGYLGDRYHRPKLMALGLFLWSLATASSGIATGFLLFLILRILVGVGEASFGTIAPGYIKEQCESSEETNKALGIFYASIPIGAALGFILGGKIASAYSWHAAFLFAGIPGIILVPFLMRFKEARISQNSDCSPSFKESFTLLFKSPIIMIAILGYILNTFGLVSLNAWISSLAEGFGYSLDEMNVYIGAITVFTGLSGTVLGAKLSNIYASKQKHFSRGLLKFIGIVSFLSVPLLFIALQQTNGFYFLSLISVIELLLFASIAPVNAVLVSESPKNMESFIQGVCITMINIFGALPGPALVGRFADQYSLSMSLQLTTIAIFLSGCVWRYGGSKEIP